jgi:hypothetical protein
MAGTFWAVPCMGIIQDMSETPEPSTQPTSAVPPAPPVGPPPGEAVAHSEKPPTLYRAAAWVVIVAGIVFIVAVIFFSGFSLGRHSQMHWYPYHHGMFRPGGPPGGPPPGAGEWLFPGGPGFPGGPPGSDMGPGGPPMMPMMPGGPGMGPGSPSPTTTAPPLP